MCQADSHEKSMSQGDSDEKPKMESRPHFDSQEEPKMAHIVIKDSPRKPQRIGTFVHLCSIVRDIWCYISALADGGPKLKVYLPCYFILVYSFMFIYQIQNMNLYLLQKN